jgi:hypothetical protein
MSGALENRWALEFMPTSSPSRPDSGQGLRPRPGESGQTRGAATQDRGPGPARPWAGAGAQSASLTRSGWGQWRGRAARPGPPGLAATAT